MILIKLDATKKVGSGHAMRCIAIAKALQSIAVEFRFIVSCEESRAFLNSRGFCCDLAEGNPLCYDQHTAKALIEFYGKQSHSLLIDSYAVTASFFDELSSSADFSVAYIDDQFTYEFGRLQAPQTYPVDTLISYGFYSSLSEYERVYTNHNTRLCIGPKYAPVRSEFACRNYTISYQPKNILVTTGSTNPEGLLEQIVENCHDAFPDLHITAVTGGLSSQPELNIPNVSSISDVKDMSELMLQADIAISAGGTTLYELAAIGVPTIAFPMVDNQEKNVEGFVDLNLGLPMKVDLSFETSLLKKLLDDYKLRCHLSKTMQSTVDGMGALRIAKTLSDKRT